MSAPFPSDPTLDLLQAFLHTEYIVSTPEQEQTLRIGQLHPALDRMIDRRDWAIVTACNPGATRLDETSNRELQQRLTTLVELSGLEYFHARNCDPNGQWSEEPGLMILDADHERVVRLAKQFGQLGFVAGRAGQPAGLYLIGDDWPQQLPPCVRRAEP